MALDATVGGPNANAYVTRAEGDAYFADRLYAIAWTGAGDTDKDNSIITAALLIDRRVCFTGNSATSTQARRWPVSGHLTRNGYLIPDDELPLDLKHANLELALYLLNAGTDASQPNEVVEQGLTLVKAGPIELRFKEALESISIPSNVLSMFPSSWLCPEVLKTFSIEVYR